MSPAEIKALRGRYKESQEAFARRVGVTRNTIWTWEAGAKTPTGPAVRLMHFLAREIAGDERGA